MAGIRTLSGLFRAVALYLPRIFVWVIVALECGHRNLTDRFLLFVQLPLNLRIDFASVGIMQPLHSRLVIRYTGCADVVWRYELVQFVQRNLNHVFLDIGIARVVITEVIPLFKRVSSRQHGRNPNLAVKYHILGVLELVSISRVIFSDEPLSCRIPSGLRSGRSQPY